MSTLECALDPVKADEYVKEKQKETKVKSQVSHSHGRQNAGKITVLPSKSTNSSTQEAPDHVFDSLRNKFGDIAISAAQDDVFVFLVGITMSFHEIYS